MFRFVALLLKVQIMRELMVPSFVDTSHDDPEVELSPSLFLDLERWPLDDCLAASISASAGT